MRSTNKKFAIVIPIGSLDSMGYQYHWRDSVDSLSNSTNKLYLIPTTRKSLKVDKLPDNTSVVFDEKCIFDLDENDDEIFDIWKIYRAIEIGAQRAYADGFEYCLIASINMLIDECNSCRLNNYVESLSAVNAPMGWCRRAFVLGTHVFNDNSIIPNIYRCDRLESIKWDIDSIKIYGLKFRITKYSGLDLKPIPKFYDLLGSENEHDFLTKFNWYERGYRNQLQKRTVNKSFSMHIKKLIESVMDGCSIDESVSSELLKNAAMHYPSDSAASFIDVSIFKGVTYKPIKKYLKAIQIKMLLLFPIIAGRISNFLKL